MKIRRLAPKSRRILEAGVLSGKSNPLTTTQNGDLVFSHEQTAIDAIIKIGSVQIPYYEIITYSYVYLVCKGSITSQNNQQIFINSIVSLKNLKKLALIGIFPNINNPQLESPPQIIKNLFSDSKIIRSELACRSDIADFKEYRVLFKDTSLDVLKNVAMNPSATKYPEFKNLFGISNHVIKCALAKNHLATDFIEFKELFNINSFHVMHSLAKNPSAMKFKEYLKLFSCPYFSVRTSVLLNPKTSMFAEIYSLIPFYLRKILLTEKIVHEEALKYPEFPLLFKDPISDIRLTLACSEIAATHPAYEILFSDELEEIRAAVAGFFFKPQKYLDKYKQLSSDPSFLVRLCLFKNFDFLNLPNSVDYLNSLQFSNYFNDPNSIFEDISRFGTFIISTKLRLNMTQLIQNFAKIPIAVNSLHYHRFLDHEFNTNFEFGPYLNYVARNPNAPIVPEYQQLFRYKELHFDIATNPNAVIYPEFNSLFQNRNLFINLANNINAPYFYNYKKFFDYVDNELLDAVMKNPNAQNIYDLSIVKQHQAFLKDIESTTKNRKFLVFIFGSKVKSKFVGNKIELHVSKKQIEEFRHLLIEDPLVLRYITPSSVKQLLTIGMLKVILKNEPSFMIGFITQTYLGRSELLHEISAVILHVIQEQVLSPSIRDLRQIIQCNIAKLLPKYENFDIDFFDEMKYFTEFDNNEMKIKDFFDLIDYSGLSFEEVYRLLLWSSYSHFKPYLYIEIPKKSGGVRNISIPVSKLKKLQTCIKEAILDYVSPHSCVFSFQKGKNPTDNAKYHISDKKIVLIKIDLKDFFPNINIYHVYRLFRNLGYNHDFSLILTHLCIDRKWIPSGKGTFKGAHNYYLPQGAPTSPQISNLIFSDVDIEFEQFSRSKNLKYSRYADDLIFSTEDLNVDVGAIIKSLLQILKNHRFVFNKEKIQVLRPGTRQIITGIVVNNGIHAKKEVINRIRGLIHILKNKISDIHPNYQKIKQQLNGLIAHLNTIEPNKAEKYWVEYQKLK